ncbi:ATP-dependent Clp protease adapter ClpS [Actinobaculum sp. 313]|uniref:ATP-dependent Clp protease adapter ClpS n=1 Tax=Actinobaculum sp. 313 TaxID=2495645 RepID=UPI001F0B8090|nr:ATP-dependent Clp protease adapter ClpS [Actinobaculum sp. 313]
MRGRWRTVVHDDPINLMSYVEWVFSQYFGMDARTANRVMMRVHTQGRATVSRGQREQMELDAQAMHTYGLWATIEEEQ